MKDEQQTQTASVNDDEARSSGGGVTFQSRLQAKRQERLQQRMQQQQQASLQAQSPSVETVTALEQPNESLAASVAASGATRVVHETGKQRPRSSSTHRHGHSSTASAASSVSAATTRDSSEVDARVRLRGEARRAIVSYGGTVWDALRARNLELVQHFFVVEGAQRLLGKRSPEFSDAGRSLLHCAAW